MIDWLSYKAEWKPRISICSNSHIQLDVKRRVDSSFPHYGHWGIVEAARELYMQVEGNPRDDCELFWINFLVLTFHHELLFLFS